MNLVTQFVFTLLLLLSLYNVDCKKRHHRHKKLVSDGGTEDATVAAASSDPASAAPPTPVAPAEEHPNLTPQAVTPADSPPAATTQQFTPKTDNTLTQSAASEPVAAPTPAIAPSPKEPAQKSDTPEEKKEEKTEKKDKEKEYRWTNHTIPFLKRFKKEIDGGKIKHHNYEEMTWFLKYFAEEFPDITRLYSIGRSVQNRKLWVLEISDNPGVHDPGEPEMKYIGNVHGNEVIGREILLQLVKHLCTGYEEDSQVRNLVENTRIHILPSLNPDGYELSATHKKSLNPDITEDVIGRLNANGVDLNRNFPDQFFEANTDSYEPESEAVMTWIRRYPFALSASFHSGALVVTYPFDDSPSGQTQYSATPDDDLFRQISKTYSENHPKMHLANPHEINCTRSLKRFTDGISNGASWSPLTGGMQDYNYVKSNCYEVTVELGCEKFPHEENLKTYWSENKKSLLKFIEFSNRGVKGFVKDHQGNPIKGARISVGDRKHDVRSALDGDYWRLLVPGTYELECHAKGFKRNAANVEIPIGGQVVVNFTMLPKQIDELEEALGHVNKATLLSHDLMYRFDGRDSGNAAPKEVMQKVEAQRTGRENEVLDRSEVGSGEDSSMFQEFPPAEAISPRYSASEHAPFSPNNYYDMSFTDIIGDNKRNNYAPRTPPNVTLDKLVTNRATIKKENMEDLLKSVSKVKADNVPISRGIDDSVKEAIAARFHIAPHLEMKLACKVPNADDKLNGTLKYLGYIKNLPKRSDRIIAGLELDTDQSLGTDGTFLGKRYFNAPSKRGYFVPFASCMMDE